VDGWGDCGSLGALWVRGCFVTKRWRMYCSDTRVVSGNLQDPLLPRTVYYNPSVFLLLEKVTILCDVLGTT
jgi:hypothetical protein